MIKDLGFLQRYQPLPTEVFTYLAGVAGSGRGWGVNAKVSKGLIHGVLNVFFFLGGGVIFFLFLWT